MRVYEFVAEDQFGVVAKRPNPRNVRGIRGHREVPLYRVRPSCDECEQAQECITIAECPGGMELECESCIAMGECPEVRLDERGKASKKVCKSRVTDRQLGRSTLSSCIAQGYRPRTTNKKFRINGKVQKVKGKHIPGARYGGPIPGYGKNK
jgi:hypothetical protein